MMVFLFALGLSVALVLLGKPLAIRVGLMDRPRGHKLHENPTPVIGGPVIFLTVFLTMILFLEDASSMDHVVIDMLPLLLLGLVDDFYELRPSSRLIVQIAVVTQILVTHNVSFMNLGPLFGQAPVVLGWWAWPFTVFALVGFINALNLIDGMDGLAPGVAAIGVSLLLLVGSILNCGGDLITLALAILGGLVGFLVFNLRHPWNPRASVFLGDSGSLLLGLLLGALLYKFTQRPNHFMPAVLGLWLFLVPLFDTGSVMIRRILSGKSLFEADRLHLHHMLMDAGFSYGQALAIIFASAAGFGLLGVGAWVLGVPDRYLMLAFLMLFFVYLGLCFRILGLAPWVRGPRQSTPK